MISEIQIENFKSIANLSLKPGNVTVLIGENGSGKSNLLEAIAFAAAASVDKLDDEFLYNRGIRVTDDEWMTSAFVDDGTILTSEGEEASKLPISLRVSSADSGRPLGMKIRRSRLELIRPFWRVSFDIEPEEIEEIAGSEEFAEEWQRTLRDHPEMNSEQQELIRSVIAQLSLSTKRRREAPGLSSSMALRDFLIYAPENTALRNFETEGAIKPLGIKGEGLLKLLSTSAENGGKEFGQELRGHLKLLGWFEDLLLPNEDDELKGRLEIHDRWLADRKLAFDQRSANEGFLYLLFYFTLLLSKKTPAFFAIDNIDNSLNPKLCSQLMRQVAALAEKSGKQVICTTHNPAILDGLNLRDDRQRLYVIRRDSEGRTVATRVKAPRPRADGGDPIPLSAAFMSGMLGGLPDHF
ncbi:AAA family ATPase [Luteolibacter sp. Populi]|uniref:AAA family ATPase n=1 Tax=Luteolibacter sp. Populi TaxID=3230487 RepID=UPI003465B17F